MIFFIIKKEKKKHLVHLGNRFQENPELTWPVLKDQFPCHPSLTQSSFGPGLPSILAPSLEPLGHGCVCVCVCVCVHACGEDAFSFFFLSSELGVI